MRRLPRKIGDAGENFLRLFLIIGMAGGVARLAIQRPMIPGIGQQAALCPQTHQILKAELVNFGGIGGEDFNSRFSSFQASS